MKTVATVGTRAVVSLGVLAEAVPAPISFNASQIASELLSFTEQAAKAEGVAERAEVTDQETFDRATDVASAIAKTVKAIDASRKNHTGLLDTAKEALSTLFNTPRERLTKAKSDLINKMEGWQRSEAARRRREAEAQAERQREDAERLARAQAAMGDEEGAAQIVAEAQELMPTPEKVSGSGMYGGASNMRKRAVGTVTDKRAFLAWALQANPAIIEAVTIPATPLNTLAKGLLESESKSVVPGFKYEYDESLTIR